MPGAYGFRPARLIGATGESEIVLRERGMRVLVTCPPMLSVIDRFRSQVSERGAELTTPEVVQVLSEEQLFKLLPSHDGWIVGDDPATAKVLQAGRDGGLRAVIKWGIGIDNIDLAAIERLGLQFTNTPGMFGSEVADVAMSYVTALARETFYIDRCVRRGGWPKPRGISLRGKIMALVGVGDIGRNVARRALAADMSVRGYDPAFDASTVPSQVEHWEWPRGLEEADFIVFTCALTNSNFHMFDADCVSRTKPGMRVVNVARGGLIDQAALVDGLRRGIVHSAALDVMEHEPLAENSPLREFEKCVFGSHNASNTEEAVIRTTTRAIEELFRCLKLR